MFRLIIGLCAIGLMCCQSRAPEILTAKVKSVSYQNKLKVEGKITASSHKTIYCPDIGSSTIVYIVENGQNVNKGDTLCILESEALELQYDQIKNNIAESESEHQEKISSYNLAITLINLDIQHIEAQTDITKLDEHQLAFAGQVQSELIDIKLKIAELQKQKLIKKRAAEMAIHKSEMKRINLKLNHHKKRFKEVEKKMSHRIIKAPQDGMVYIHKPWWKESHYGLGDKINPKNHLFEVPTDQVQVECQVSENKFKQIQVGQKAQFVVASVGKNVEATVTKKAQFGKPISKRSAVKFYKITLELEKQDPALIQGINVKGDIILSELTDQLYVPIQAVGEEDGQQYVYVQNEASFIKTNVSVKSKEGDYAIINQGISMNDAVALNFDLIN